MEELFPLCSGLALGALLAFFVPRSGCRRERRSQLGSV